MSRTAHTLAEQIGRAWAANSSLGLTFAEPRSPAKANIYARPMPDKKHRLSPCVSITPTPAAVGEAMSPTHAIGLVVEVHAETERAAHAIIEELWLILWPNDRPYSPVPQTVHGQSVVGVIGAPSATVGGSADLWRIIAMQPIQMPATVTGPLANARTVEGHAMATFTLEASCVRVTIDTPSIAFTVMAPEAAFTAGTVTVGAASATFSLTPAVPGNIILYAMEPTLGDLRAAIAALGVTVGEIDESLDGRASVDLVAMGATDILGILKTRDIVVGIEE